MPRSPESHSTAQPACSGGCLRAGLVTPLVIALAPLAAAVRGLRRWRRGAATRASHASRTVAERCRHDIRLDLPEASEAAARLRVTEVVVRVAEALRAPDDVYHLLWRSQSDEPAQLRAIGPQVQELGDHLALELGRPVTRGHTLLWLALGSEQRLGRVVDAATADPDAGGEPDALVTSSNPRWAAATAVAYRHASVVFHLAVWCSPDAEKRVERIVRRLAR